MVGTPLTSPLVPSPPLSHAGPERAAASRLPGLAAPPTSRSPPNRLRRRALGPAHTVAARAGHRQQPLLAPVAMALAPLCAWCWRLSPTPSLCKSAQPETLGRVPLANQARSLKRKRDKNKRERKERREGMTGGSWSPVSLIGGSHGSHMAVTLTALKQRNKRSSPAHTEAEEDSSVQLC